MGGFFVKTRRHGFVSRLPLSSSLVTLLNRFALEAKKSPQRELHIRADRLARYELVAQVMSAAAKAGIVRIGFVTDPAPAP